MLVKSQENYLQLSDILELTGKKDVKTILNELCDQLREYHNKKSKKENVDALEQDVKTKALFFAKVLFEYILSFEPKFPVPDLSSTENLDDILNADKDTLDIWGPFLTDIKNLKLSNLFNETNSIVAKRFLHTEYLLYYHLNKTNAFNFPLYFVSYLHMCKNCETFWAQKTTYEENKYNVVCISKESPKGGSYNYRKKESTNNSFLQIRYKK